MFKYSLDKSSKKFICPKCNKKTFVKYIDNENNTYLENNHGRCDRESKCSFHLKPSNSHQIIDINIIDNTSSKQSFIDLSEVAKHGNNFKNNNFIQFLKSYFTTDEIKEAILRYFIGTSSFWNGATIFWQITPEQKVAAGKVMLYDKTNGKRVKHPFNHINWMHKVLKIENYNLKQCLFGLHLINGYCGQKIAVTESEKTAIIMSIFKPEYIWLATGNRNNFKKDILTPIKRYEIIAFPDQSEYLNWSETAKLLNKEGFKIKCSDILENKNYPEGYDLADVFIEIKSNRQLNERERIIQRLAKVNPLILELIETFDLT